LRQLDLTLTFDPEFMPPGGLSAILPVEFAGWKKGVAKVTYSSPQRNDVDGRTLIDG
jgi:hypothetical protein